MPAPQSFKCHARWEPTFHFFVLPILLLNIIFSIYSTIHHWPDDSRLHIWWIVMAIRPLRMPAPPVAARSAPRTASSASKSVSASPNSCPHRQHARIAELTIPQLIGLRFASDEELPALPERPSTRASTRKPSSKASSTGAPTTTASRHFPAISSKRRHPKRRRCFCVYPRSLFALFIAFV